MGAKGSLEVICGCMYSGKTEELIRRVKREEIAKRKIQVFKSHLDTRYSLESIQTHNGNRISAHQVPLSSSKRLEAMIDPTADVIAIDEIQFFDDAVVSICDRLAQSGVRVIVAGLDLDFRCEPFGPMPGLLAKADKIDKLTAVCVVVTDGVVCGEPATRSQRLVDGQPAKWDEAVLVVGAYDTYKAVCRQHHYIERPVAPDEVEQESA
jgi:thymidine kinase